MDGPAAGSHRVWYVIPSANPPRATECLARWKAQGYSTAVVVDQGMAQVPADFWGQIQPYPGYFPTVNQLIQKLWDQADLFVTGGDDMYPDPNLTAQELAAQFFERFPDGYGVMQPTGDRGIPGVDNICGSPWIGKAFIERTYGGKGPFWPFYYAYYGDEELCVVAKQLGVLWQRQDVTQHHAHFSRPGGLQKQPYQSHNERYWKRDQTIFFERKRAGFPGLHP